MYFTEDLPVDHQVFFTILSINPLTKNLWVLMNDSSTLSMSLNMLEWLIIKNWPDQNHTDKNTIKSVHPSFTAPLQVCVSCFSSFHVYYVYLVFGAFKVPVVIKNFHCPV